MGLEFEDWEDEQLAINRMRELAANGTPVDPKFGVSLLGLSAEELEELRVQAEVQARVKNGTRERDLK